MVFSVTHTILFSLVVNENKNFIIGIFCDGLYLLASMGLFVSSSFAQQNMTNIPAIANETGEMMRNQTGGGVEVGVGVVVGYINIGGGNETQQGVLEELSKALGGILDRGNQSQ